MPPRRAPGRSVVALGPADGVEQDRRCKRRGYAAPIPHTTPTVVSSRRSDGEFRAGCRDFDSSSIVRSSSCSCSLSLLSLSSLSPSCLLRAMMISEICRGSRPRYSPTIARRRASGLRSAYGAATGSG